MKTLMKKSFIFPPPFSIFWSISWNQRWEITFEVHSGESFRIYKIPFTAGKTSIETEYDCYAVVNPRQTSESTLSYNKGFGMVHQIHEREIMAYYIKIAVNT